MLTKTYKDVADEVGLKGEIRIKYLAFMIARWEREEQTQCVTGYAREWAEKFKAKLEYICADSLGQSILNGLNATFKEMNND